MNTLFGSDLFGNSAEGPSDCKLADQANKPLRDPRNSSQVYYDSAMSVAYLYAELAALSGQKLRKIVHHTGRVAPKPNADEQAGDWGDRDYPIRD